MEKEIKKELIHIRIEPTVKEKSERIFDQLGINMSYAVSLFLNQVILKNGFPFDVNLPKSEENPIERLAYIMNSVDGKEPTLEAKKIIHLYTNGDIDLETAKFAILRSYKKWKIFTSTTTQMS